MATRLSEDPATRVVLLEAGGEDRNRWIHIPLGYGKTFADASVNWCYEAEPDPGPTAVASSGRAARCSAVPRRSTAWSISAASTRTSICGGSSATPAGRPPTCCRTSSARNIRRAAPTSSTAPAARSACPTPPSTTRSARRSSRARWNSAIRATTTSTARSRTASATTRPPRATASAAPPRSAICIRCATGPICASLPARWRRRSCSRASARSAWHFASMAQPRTVRAAREVILCGGAVNSPQLLLLSGVGPAGSARAVRHPVVHHLPGVGQSLQDHYSAPIKLKCRLPITVNDVMQSNVKKLKVGLQYYLFRTGPLTMAAGPAALFVRTRAELASPDVKISVAPFSSDKLQDGLHPWSGFGLTVYQLRPESRGEIRLKSANPSDPPAMFPNYLADRDRPPRHRRRPEDRPAHPRHAADAAFHHRGIPARPVGADRRTAAAAREEHRRHGVPPDQHLQDGRRSDGGGGSRTAGATASRDCAWSTRRSCRR